MNNLFSKFESICKKFKDNIALSYPTRDYTYGELYDESIKYSLLLERHQFESGDVLCVANTKTIDSYAIMLSCLRLGVAYVNLDIDNPISRNQKIINTCKPKALFEDSDSSDFKEFSNNSDIVFLNSKDKIKDVLSDDGSKQVYGNSLAYIMFTSGSTGDPKGVAITHQNVLHFIEWVQNRYQISSEDNFANLSPMYFDNSVFDFYGSLFNGATLTPVPKLVLNDPLKLVKYVDDMKCTIWFSVPSLLIYLINMKVLNSNTLQNIRVFTFGGEGFPKMNLKKLFDLYSHSAQIINVYGPTEGTCICSSHIITNDDFKDMSELPSLGKINPNFYFEIDTSSNQNGIGELIIIGPNIGAGYYNYPSKTKESFGIIDQGKYYFDRYYKTGDLVQELDGLLYFKGRVDNQIKHMGYRIELEEIENALNLIDGISESAVVYKRINDSYGKILAYIVSDNKEVSEIKSKLKLSIPNYMIPNNIDFMDVLPKNANGKIDRKNLAIL